MANTFENTHEERKIITKKKICGYDLVNTTTEKEFGEANTIGQLPDKAITADSAHLVAYTCDLDFGVNDEHPESYEGVVYYFDHWVICTPCIISQPCTDIREDWVSVTYLLEYREDMQILMRKKDLKQIGFRLYLTERIKNTINFLNRSNFPASHNLEDIKAYRDIATTLSFINKYNMDLFGLGSKDDYILIWSTDNDDKIYQFELVRLPAKVEQVPTKEWLNNLRQTGTEEEIKPETSHPSTDKEVEIKFETSRPSKEDEEYISAYASTVYANTIASTLVTQNAKELISDIKRMMEEANADVDARLSLADNCIILLNTLVAMVNKDIDDGCPLDNVNDTEHAKTMYELFGWAVSNMDLLNLKKDIDEISLTVDDAHHVNLTINMH